MYTKTVTIYAYDELPTDKAKENARDWFRSVDQFSDYVEYEDFLTICDAMGVTVGRDAKGAANIYWSGFSSQGDGACFHGTYQARQDAGEAIRAHAGRDEELHRIGDAFTALAVKYPNLSATIARPYGTHYSHDMTMFVTDISPCDDDEADEAISDEDFSVAENEVQDLCRALARWLYKDLESEYDARNSDEAVAETIRINEYSFNEDGNRED